MEGGEDAYVVIYLPNGKGVGRATIHAAFRRYPYVSHDACEGQRPDPEEESHRRQGG